jgi:hypothetical protein
MECMELVNNRVQKDTDTTNVNKSNLYVTGLFQFHDAKIPSFKDAVAKMATNYCDNNNISTSNLTM